MIRPCPLRTSEQLFDAGLFQVASDRARSPRTGAEHDFHVASMPDWLMVVALTKEGKLVLVRQCWHGSRTRHATNDRHSANQGEDDER